MLRKCTLSGTWNDSSRVRMVSIWRMLLRSAQREAVGGGADGLEHEVREHDGLVALGPAVELVERARGGAHGTDLTAEIRDELGEELTVPALLVAIEAERVESRPT